MNVAEGRDDTVVRALAESCGDALLDVHTDTDHDRAVFTLLGDEPDGTAVATRALAAQVAARVSIAGYDGVHPILGALDVVPFVALAGGDAARADAAGVARAFGTWWAETANVPVFFYDDADRARRTLPSARRDAFRTRAPDAGPHRPHPALGATAVGARRPLVAVNLVLDRADVDVARRLARAVRERDGGLPGVRALGLALASAGHVQVSMNLVDLERTGLEAACTAVRDRSAADHARVTAVELVGLVPAAELRRCSPEFLAWSGIDAGSTIEHRAAVRPEPGREPPSGRGPQR